MTHLAFCPFITDSSAAAECKALLWGNHVKMRKGPPLQALLCGANSPPIARCVGVQNVGGVYRQRTNIFNLTPQYTLHLSLWFIYTCVCACVCVHHCVLARGFMAD